MKNYRDSQISRLLRSGAEVRLRTPVTPELVAQIAPDVLIVAVGSQPFFLPIPGAHGDNVVAGAQLRGNEKAGRRVVVIGGGLVGCEEALLLTEKGYEVTIVEMQSELAAECTRMHRLGLLHEIEHNARLATATGTRCTAITENSVEAVDADGQAVSFPCDWVVMAAGMRADTQTVEQLRGLVPETYVIGDCKKATTVLAAVRDAHDAAVDLGL